MMLGFSMYHSDADGGGGVVDYFFSPEPQRGAGAKHGAKRTPCPERLVGDPKVFKATVRALPHANLYRSGVLSFDVGDMDIVAFNSGDSKARRIAAEIIDLLKETLCPGIPLASRPHLIVGTHTHTGRLELNFALPQMVIRPDGALRAFNPEPPTEGAKALWVAARDMINLRFGFADPEDPARRQLVSGPSWRRKRAAAAIRDGSDDVDMIDVRINGLADLAKTLRPRDRDAFIQIVNDHFAPVGMQVITVSRTSLRVGPAPETAVGKKTSFKLTGLLCNANFSPDQLNLDDPEAAAERKRVLQTAPTRFAAAWEKVAAYNRRRFGQGVWPDMPFDPEAWLRGATPPETCLPLRHHLLPVTIKPEDRHDPDRPHANGNSPAGHRQSDAIRASGRPVASEAADRRPAAGDGDPAIKDRSAGRPTGMADPDPDRLAAAIGPLFAPERLSRLAAGLTAVFRWIADHYVGWIEILRVGRIIPPKLITSFANLATKQETLHELISNHPLTTPDRRPDRADTFAIRAARPIGRTLDGAVKWGLGDGGGRRTAAGGNDPATDQRIRGPSVEHRSPDAGLRSGGDADANGSANAGNRDRSEAGGRGAAENGRAGTPDRRMADGQRLTPPGPGSRFWLISSIRRVMERVGRGASFSMAPSVDQTDRFAINLDMGEIGALQVTAVKVRMVRNGDARRLTETAARIERHLGILPAEARKPVPEPAPRERLLVLYENRADAAYVENLTVGTLPVEIIARPALDMLTRPMGIEKIASYLRDGKFAACLLIAGSRDGPAPALAPEWTNLENAVQRNGELCMVNLEPGEGLRVIRSNATRLAELDQESAESRAPNPPEQEPTDPDPW